MKKINEVFFSIFPRVLCKIPFKLPIAVCGSDMSERIQLKVKKTGGIWGSLLPDSWSSVKYSSRVRLQGFSAGSLICAFTRAEVLWKVISKGASWGSAGTPCMVHECWCCSLLTETGLVYGICSHLSYWSTEPGYGVSCKNQMGLEARINLCFLSDGLCDIFKKHQHEAYTAFVYFLFFFSGAA